MNPGPEGLEWSSPQEGACWSNGALQNIKFQAPNRGPAQRVGTPKEKSQGLRCSAGGGSGVMKKKQVSSAGGGLVIVICLIFGICYLEFFVTPNLFQKENNHEWHRECLGNGPTTTG